VTGYKKIFLDTTPIIYYLDQDPNFGMITQNLLSDFLDSGSDFVTSSITFTEYLTYPYRTNNTDKIDAFLEFINDCEIPVHKIDIITAQKAARIRAEYKHFKTIDCLQIASACITECDLFLTNDKQLKQFKELPCLTVEDLTTL